MFKLSAIFMGNSFYASAGALIPGPARPVLQIHPVQQQLQGLRGQTEFGPGLPRAPRPVKGPLFQPLEARNTLHPEVILFIDKALEFDCLPDAARFCLNELAWRSFARLLFANRRAGSSMEHPWPLGALEEDRG